MISPHSPTGSSTFPHCHRQQHFLDDQRKFVTFIYIRPRFAGPNLSCGSGSVDTVTMMMISETWPRTPSTLRLAIRVRAQYIRRQMITKPPPRRIGQEATSAPAAAAPGGRHRASLRSHCGSRGRGDRDSDREHRTLTASRRPLGIVGDGHGVP